MRTAATHSADGMSRFAVRFVWSGLRSRINRESFTNFYCRAYYPPVFLAFFLQGTYSGENVA